MCRISKYTVEERQEIGRKIAEHELTVFSAATLYDISPYTARDYLRIYKAGSTSDIPIEEARKYKNLTREQLIEDLIRTKQELNKLKQSL